MSEIKYTPGPWEGRNAAIFAGPHCIGITYTDNADYATYEANARLMAAAPEMLEVLKRAVANNMLVEGSAWWGDVYAAIAKAEGRS